MTYARIQLIMTAGYRTGAETRLNCRPGWSERCLTLPLTQTTLVERVPNEIRTRVEQVGAWIAVAPLGTTFGIAAWRRSVLQYAQRQSLLLPMLQCRHAGICSIE